MTIDYTAFLWSPQSSFFALNLGADQRNVAVFMSCRENKLLQRVLQIQFLFSLSGFYENGKELLSHSKKLTVHYVSPNNREKAEYV